MCWEFQNIKFDITRSFIILSGKSHSITLWYWSCHLAWEEDYIRMWALGDEDDWVTSGEWYWHLAWWKELGSLQQPPLCKIWWTEGRVRTLSLVLRPSASDWDRVLSSWTLSLSVFPWSLMGSLSLHKGVTQFPFTPFSCWFSCLLLWRILPI